MDLKIINTLISDLSSLYNNPKLKYVEKIGDQEEYDYYSEIYQILDQENLYLKVTIYVDSYGEDRITGVEFVQSKQVDELEYKKI